MCWFGLITGVYVRFLRCSVRIVGHFDLCGEKVSSNFRHEA